ncbi:MAG: gliding motility-associated C-terminal domain-containing protein [Bacteroidota bacterium]
MTIHILRSFLLVTVISASLVPGFAQKEGNIWHFGMSHALSFASGSPVELTGSKQWTLEGCASICDTAGNLLFYTNGGGRDPILSGQSSGKIWDKQNNVLYDMGDSEGGGFTAAQSSVFVPKPGSPGHYYLFTMEETGFNIGSSTPGQPLGRGLSWFELDAAANGGLGAVVNKQMMLQVPSYEGLCAIRHPNNQDYWIIVNEGVSGGIAVFSVTAAGIQPSGVYFSGYSNAYFKGSPDGRFLAVENTAHGVDLYQFDAATGTPKTPVNIPNAGDSFEFSPNGRYLYAGVRVSNPGALEIRQYDLTAANIPGSKKVVTQYQADGSTATSPGKMQVAPDHKIYIVVEGGLKTQVCAIACANSSTPFFEPAVFAYTVSSTTFFLGFPNFDNKIFYYQNPALQVDAGPDTVSICGSNSAVLNAVAPGAQTYKWSNGATSQSINVTLPGTYIVTATDACGTSGVDSVVVTGGMLVSIEVSKDTCAGRAALLAHTNGANLSLLWENNSISPTRTVTKSGIYSVTATDPDGCSSTASVSISLTPPINLTVRPDTSVLAGKQVQIIGTIDTSIYKGTYKLFWSNASPALSCNNCLSPLATLKKTSIFILKATRPDGCMYVDTVTIKVDTMPIRAPNVFTPNNDQVNDVFMLLGGLGDEMVNFFRVYDRWGENMYINEYFMLSAPNAGWDGNNLNGFPAVSDVYFWVAELEYPDGRKETRKGQVTLLR